MALDKPTRDWLILQAVTARRGREHYDTASWRIADHLEIPIKEAKQLSVSLYQRFLKSLTEHQQLQFHTSELATADQVQVFLNPLTDSLIPDCVPSTAFRAYFEQLKMVNADYVARETSGRHVTPAESQLLLMLANGELTAFFDRLFERREGLVCCHDKTVAVLAAVRKAILNHQNLPLISYFDEHENPSLAGKRTYWSTEVFRDTDEVIQFLTDRFYL